MEDSLSKLWGNLKFTDAEKVDIDLSSMPDEEALVQCSSLYMVGLIILDRTINTEALKTTDHGHETTDHA